MAPSKPYATHVQWAPLGGESTHRVQHTALPTGYGSIAAAASLRQEPSSADTGALQHGAHTGTPQGAGSPRLLAAANGERIALDWGEAWGQPLAVGAHVRFRTRSMKSATISGGKGAASSSAASSASALPRERPGWGRQVGSTASSAAPATSAAPAASAAGHHQQLATYSRQPTAPHSHQERSTAGSQCKENCQGLR
jgi:hypothetical protein